MTKRWVAIGILLLGIAGFWGLQGTQEENVFSPQSVFRPLYGVVIGVDAGHGGYDGGCEGAGGTLEKDVNLSLSQLLREELENRGAIVVMSRETDVALIDPKTTKGYKKRQELNRRLILFHEQNVELMVSIHMNASPDAGNRGAAVFYKKGAKEGESLAVCLAARLLKNDREYARPASIGDYYMLNACDAAALVECGFLTNEEEEALLCDEAYRCELAFLLAEGIEDYLLQKGCY